MRRLAGAMLVAAVMVAGTLAAAEDQVVECAQDTFLQKGITGAPGGGTGNRGVMPEWKLMNSPPNPDWYRALLKFDNLPRAYFKSARLRFQILNMGLGRNPGKIEVHKVTTGWDEKSASEDQAGKGTKWKAPMGDFDPKVYGIADLSLLPQVNAAVITIDITDLVNEWEAKPETNLGLMLMLTKDSTADLRCISKEAEDKTKRSFPVLILTDRPPLHPGDMDLDFETSALASGKTGEAYDMTIKARGGKPPYVFTVEGMLPRGLKFDKDGKFSGTPEMVGKYLLRVKLEDGTKFSMVQQYPLEVTKGEAKPPEPGKPGEKPGEKPKPPVTDPNVPHDDG